MRVDTACDSSSRAQFLGLVLAATDEKATVATAVAGRTALELKCIVAVATAEREATAAAAGSNAVGSTCTCRTRW